MGAERVTTQNLTVVASDVDRGLIFVRGAVPGHDQGYVLVKDAVKKVQSGLPFPASLKAASAPAVAEPEAPAVEAAVETEN
jgi:large subunit ribosomal protein L3